jgi:beta-lactamase class D
MNTPLLTSSFKSVRKSNLIVFFLCILIAALLPARLYPQEIKQIDLKKYFDEYGVEGCFVLFDQSNNLFLCYNPAGCDSGYLPASTFKIPNSVIALEEKIITDTGQVFRWDGREWPVKSWNQDQTLRSAIRFSCIWVFIHIAEEVSTGKYNQYLNSFKYGNMNLSGPPTRFWLAGELRISAFQQVEFLRRFYNYELDVSRESVDEVKDMIILEKKNDYVLSGKTGGTEISENDYIMWLIGYIELDRDVYFYAMNFTTRDYEETRHARYDIILNILKSLKLIE